MTVSYVTASHLILFYFTDGFDIEFYIKNGIRSLSESFDFFVDMYLSSVVNGRTIAELKSSCMFSEYGTRTDEAFVLLVLKNSEGVWLDMILTGEQKSKVKFIYTKKEGNVAGNNTKLRSIVDGRMKGYKCTIRL